MFDKFKNFLSNPVKAKVGNNFYNSISSAQDDSKVIQKEKSQDTVNLLEESINDLKKFMSDTEDDLAFNNALEGFKKYTEIKPSSPEGYFYLAYIFYLCDELDMAIKYINTTKILSPNFEGIALLQEDINNRISIKDEILVNYGNNF